MNEAFSYPLQSVELTAAKDLPAEILPHVGASPYRDAVDSRVDDVWETTQGVASPSDVIEAYMIDGVRWKNPGYEAIEVFYFATRDRRSLGAKLRCLSASKRCDLAIGEDLRWRSFAATNCRANDRLVFFFAKTPSARTNSGDFRPSLTADISCPALAERE